MFDIGQESLAIHGTVQNKRRDKTVRWGITATNPVDRFEIRDGTTPELTYRHRWSPGDVVAWDNRATLHVGVRDFGDAHRVLHRVTIAGDRPR